MERFNKNDDVVELGNVSQETHGSDNFGREDTQTQAYYLLGGIQSDD
ncbi:MULTISPECIES: hypothetical protein [unclassified Sphingomonas]|nr:MULTISPECIES: hypothetical protein [unclassified Sphingomonas]MBN8846989.1 hypothetical protein [Sphingomonas sp.]